MQYFSLENVWPSRDTDYLSPNESWEPVIFRVYFAKKENPRGQMCKFILFPCQPTYLRTNNNGFWIREYEFNEMCANSDVYVDIEFKRDTSYLREEYKLGKRPGDSLPYFTV